MPKKHPNDFEYIKRKFETKRDQTIDTVYSAFPHLEHYFQTRGLSISTLRQQSAKLLSLGALTATVMLSPPSDVAGLKVPKEIVDKLHKNDAEKPDSQIKRFLTDVLKEVLPQHPRSLSADEEQYLERLFTSVYSIDAKARLEDQHLNTTYGFIGAEQHLAKISRRYAEKPRHRSIPQIWNVTRKRGLGVFCSVKNDAYSRTRRDRALVCSGPNHVSSKLEIRSQLSA